MFGAQYSGVPEFGGLTPSCTDLDSRCIAWSLLKNNEMNHDLMQPFRAVREL